MGIRKFIGKLLGYEKEIVYYPECLHIEGLCKMIHQNAVKKGFWKDYDDVQKMKDLLQYSIYKESYNSAISKRLMLITSEVAEALESLRKDDMENFKEEIADIVIRCMDLSAGLKINLSEEIGIKHQKNVERPYKHDKSF